MPRRATRHSEARLELPGDRPLTIAVVADTHSAPHPKALELIAAEEPDAILHAGDVGALGVLDELAEIAEVIAVRGNIDGRQVLPDSIAIDAGGVCDAVLTHIAVSGPRLRADAVRLAQRHGARMVICGHSHVPFIGEDKGLVVFNPGSIGPRRFQLPIVFGVMTVGSDVFRLEHVSCETGQRWAP